MRANILRENVMPMRLTEHIETYHSGNISAFALSIGKHRQQVQKWLKMDCIWHNGNVWQNKSNLTGGKDD
jgi:hypothetical protein